MPLLAGIVQHARGERPESAYSVNQPVPLPARPARETWTVVKPDGTKQQLAGDAGTFAATDQPGIYRLQAPGIEHEFAVNLVASESDTAPMAAEQLEQHGVLVGDLPMVSQEIERLRKMRDHELEGRQKIWKWLIVAVLGVVVCETWLARPRLTNQEPAGEVTE